MADSQNKFTLLNLKSKSIDVILTNGWDRIAYNILLGLKKENLNIAFGTDDNLGMGYFSKYVRTKFRHANYISNEEKFISDLKKVLKNIKPSVYIPTGEEVYTVSKYIKEFDGLDVKIPISDYQTLNSLNDKSQSFKIANSVSAPIPATIIPLSQKDIEDFALEHSYPVVLKNTKSNSSKGVFYITKENLTKVIKNQIEDQGLNFNEFILQQFVKGTGYGVSILMNRGNPRAVFTHKRLRERIKSGGPSTLRISTENKELEQYAIAMLTKVNFNGVAMIEFKYDETNNKGWFIEANPRFWGSVGLAINSGVNFPFLLYKMAVDGDIEPVFDHTKGITARWLIGDLNAVLKNSLKERSLIRMKDIFYKADFYDDFIKKDPLPFFARIYLQFRRKIINIIKRAE